MLSSAKQCQAVPSNAEQCQATPNNAKQRQAMPSSVLNYLRNFPLIEVAPGSGWLCVPSPPELGPRFGQGAPPFSSSRLLPPPRPAEGFLRNPTSNIDYSHV